MKRIRFISPTGILTLASAVLTISLAFFLPRLIDIEDYRDEIITMAQKSLGREIIFGKADFKWRLGPVFRFSDVSVKEKDGKAEFFKARQISFRLGIIPLLNRKVSIRNISLTAPEMTLNRDSNGVMNIDDILKSPSNGESIHIDDVKITEGILKWRDSHKTDKTISLDLREMNIESEIPSREQASRFNISFQPDSADGSKGTAKFKGRLRLPEAGKPFLSSEANCTVDLSRIDYSQLWPYLSDRLPFPHPGGNISLAAGFNGKLSGPFSSKGTIKLTQAKLVWPKVFHGPVAPKQVAVDFDLNYRDKNLDVRSLSLNTDGFSIKGTLSVRDITGVDPYISARASTAPFRLEEIKSFVPYGIIEDTVSDYIENKIRSGTFKLESGEVEGRVSQLTHMEIGTNHKTLTIRGNARNTVLSYGPKVPLFTNIAGTIELKEKDFILSDVSGIFGTSPFSLNGRITEYNTKATSLYPARMEITPKPSEISWLAGIAGIEKLQTGGASSLSLKGDGTTSSYKLSGAWQMKQASYSFMDAVDKPAGYQSQAAFSSILTKKETKLESLAFSLGQLSLSGKASLKYTDPPFLSFEIQTNRFLLNDKLPILGMWKQYRPQGEMEAHISGSGNPEYFSKMQYNGKVRLSSFSFQPGQKFKKLSNVNGDVSFKGNSAEISSINTTYGSSQIQAKARVSDFSRNEVELSVTSPALYLKDIGYSHPDPSMTLNKFNATISSADEVTRIRNISGWLNETSFAASGTLKGNKTDISVISNQMKIEDIISLSEGRREAKESGDPLEINARVSAAKVSYKGLKASKLSCAINLDQKRTRLSDLEAVLYGGKLTANAEYAAAASAKEQPGVSLTLFSDNVNAEELFHALDIPREVSGALNLSAELKAKGSTLPELKRSMEGKVRLHIEKGFLKKFSGMAKLFSLLNVSQIFRFQLPDMITGGMPFNSIKGTGTFRNGSIETKDLFMDSNAMHISIVGSADYIKEMLDMKIGVQPLQTVDRIVNRIPVVGWILTGKDSHMLTAYFEAKGPWADPAVSAIPVKSISKGVFDIFRRTLELPVRMFTDSGEVFLGQ